MKTSWADFFIHTRAIFAVITFCVNVICFETVSSSNSLSFINRSPQMNRMVPLSVSDVVAKY